MKKLLGCLVALTLAAGVAAAQDTHTIVRPSDVKWGDPPPIFSKAARFAVISGDPSKEGLFVVRLKMPAGYKVMPHWHPTDEHVTVLTGSFALGMGDDFTTKTMTRLPAGGYALLPANMHHYAMANTVAVVQVTGMGPFALTYVHPEDDPSKAPEKPAAAKK